MVAAVGVPACAKRTQNADIIGGDINNGDLIKLATLEACYTLCAKTPSCVFAKYTPSKKSCVSTSALFFKIKKCFFGTVDPESISLDTENNHLQSELTDTPVGERKHWSPPLSAS